MASWAINPPTLTMKAFSHPILLAAAGIVVALPFSLEAAGLLAFTAGLGAIIRVDYPRRYRGLPIPRRSLVPAHSTKFRLEPNRLAA